MPRKKITDPERRAHHVKATVEANLGILLAPRATGRSFIERNRGRRPPS